MTYVVRYNILYQSPMRDKKEWLITIEEKDYAGSEAAVTLRSKVDGFTLRRGARDASELQPIVASDLSLRVLVTDDTPDLRKLYSDDPSKYRVRVYLGQDIRKTRIWQGYLSTGQYSQPFANPPYTVDINATDGFDILRNTPFATSKGERWQGLVNLRELIWRLTEPLSMPLRAYIWGLDNVSIDQSAVTEAQIGLTYEGIYASMSDGETDTLPSCYDVLTAVLQNFGLQMHQGYGAQFRVRPVFTLASAERPAWYATSLPGVSERAVTLPLLGPGDYGLSTSALMTMRPPLKEVRRGDAASLDMMNVVLNSYVEPSEWVIQRGFPEPKYRVEYRKGYNGIRFAYSRYERPSSPTDRTQWWGKAIDSVIMPLSCTLTFSLDLYNLTKSSLPLGVVIIAVDAQNSLAWLNAGENYSSAMTAPKGTYMWSAQQKKWYDVSGDIYWTVLFSGITGCTLDPARVDTPMGVDVYVGEPTTVDIEVKDVPDGGALMRLAMVIFPDRYKGSFEMAAPRVNVSYTDADADDEEEEGVVVNAPAEVISISRYGSGSEEIAQRWGERGAVPALGGALSSGVVDVATGRVIAGYLSPADRCTLPDIIGMRMRQFRGRATQTLEGDIYNEQPIDFDTTWLDDEDNYYYATYIEENIRRGIQNVQLQQLPSRTRIEEVPTSYAISSQRVGFATTLIYVGSGEIRLFDTVSRETSVIATTEGDGVQIRKGINAACVSEPFAETGSRLTAYDPSGRLLSRIDDLGSAISLPDTAMQAKAMIANAVYDADISMWTIIGNEDTSDKLCIYVLDQFGILQRETTVSHGQLVGFPKLMAGGFAYSAMPLTSTTATLYWHNYLTDVWPNIALAQGNTNLKAMTDHTVIAQGSATGAIISVLPREDTTLSGTVYPSRGEFIAANDYYVLSRENTTTLRVFVPSTGVFASHVCLGTNPMLVGDKIVWQEAGKIIIKNALAGDL